MTDIGNPLVDALFPAAFTDRPLILPGPGAALGRAGFREGAARIAGALLALGLRPGERVAVQAEKSVAYLQLYLGTVMAGGVFLPLNTAYTPGELAYFLGDAAPRVFVCDPAQAAALAPVARAAGVAHLLTLDAAGQGGFADLADAAALAEPVARDSEDLAAILYTSGTTGRSKGAMLSHRALVSNARALADAWAFTPGDVLIHALPVFHTHGLFVATNVALVTGGAMIFLPKFTPDAVLDAMARGATALMGVPTFYNRLLADPRLTHDTAAGMRLFVSGSAPLLAETHRAFEARSGHAILERYGMTETNMNTSNPYAGARRPGTVGFPLPGVDLRVTDPASGRALPPGETGMIEVRGPNLFSGYWNMPEKTAEDMRPDGFFITGDLGLIDARGYVQIVGRAKDLIISGGLNVYPKEVEEAIDALPGVAESAVIGVPHPDMGEAVVAVVVPADPGLTAAAVLAGLDGRLARFKQPRHVALVAELQRNTMGKVQKAALRRDYAGLFAG